MLSSSGSRRRSSVLLAMTSSSNVVTVPVASTPMVQREKPARSPAIDASSTRSTGSRRAWVMVKRSSYGSDDRQTSSYVLAPRGATLRTCGHQRG